VTGRVWFGLVSMSSSWLWVRDHRPALTSSWAEPVEAPRNYGALHDPDGSWYAEHPSNGYGAVCEKEGWRPGPADSRFRLVHTSVAWDLAPSSCARWEGDLASIRTIDEEAFVRELSGNLTRWIGLRVRDGTLDPQWSDGTPVGHVIWAPGEPSGDGCVAHRSTGWFVSDCAELRAVLCRLDPH
jgi:hypothetical protein